MQKNSPNNIILIGGVIIIALLAIFMLWFLSVRTQMSGSSSSSIVSTLETTDWKTYSNEEYGFSFKYPNDWSIGGNNSNSIGVIIEKFNDLPLVEKVAPTSSSSPELQNQNLTEKNNLELNGASAFGGTLIRTTSTNFFRYTGYIEGGSIDIEYVTYLDDKKITIRYLEGDNADFVNALNVLGRTTLIKQYNDDSIDNQVLKQNFETLGKIIETFQK